MADKYFSWNGVDIRTLAANGTEILIRGIQFPLRQAITRHKVQISGRDGSWDFGGGDKQDYYIVATIAIIGNDIDDIMVTAATLKSAFASRGDLVLSFLPEVTHNAMVYDEIPMQIEGPGGVAEIEVNFECDALPDEEGS